MDLAREDELAFIDIIRSHELRFRHLERVSVIATETNANCLTLIDRTVLQIGAQIVEENAHLMLEKSLDLCHQPKTDSSITGVGGRGECPLDIGQRELPPRHFGGGVVIRVDGNQLGRHVTKEGARSLRRSPSVFVGQHLGKGVCPVPREHVICHIDNDGFLFVLHAPLNERLGLGKRTGFGEDQLVARLHNLGDDHSLGQIFQRMLTHFWDSHFPVS